MPVVTEELTDEQLLAELAEDVTDAPAETLDGTALLNPAGHCSWCGLEATTTAHHHAGVKHRLCLPCENETAPCAGCCGLTGLWDGVSVGDETWCLECAEGRFASAGCGHLEERDQIVSFETTRMGTLTYCRNCAEGMIQCDDCQSPVREDRFCTLTVDGTHKRLCDTCNRSYASCNGCNRTYNRHTIPGRLVRGFRGRHGHYEYCPTCIEEETASQGEPVQCRCSVWVFPNAMYEDRCYACAGHTMSADGQIVLRGSICEARDISFSIALPNHGEVANDTRFAYDIPGGEVDPSGRYEIRCALSNAGHSYNWLDDMTWDWRWQTKDGNLTKRISKHLHKNYGVKTEPSLLERIGNLAAQYTDRDKTVWCEFTRLLNQDSRRFAHTGSCWWGCYKSSRCMLKGLDGMALRTYASESADLANGRAWLLPMQVEGSQLNVAPLGEHNAWLLFNGYGMETIRFARLMAGMTGLSYKHLNFRPRIEGGEYFYINNTDTNSGTKAQSYLVAAEGDLARAPSGWEVTFRRECGCELRK